MQRMFEHIKSFASTMKAKGYDGHFLSSFGYSDRLFENMVKHVFQCYQEKRDIGPLNLMTYTHWRGDDRPHIRCNFYTDFNDNQGFKVNKLDVEYGIGYETLKRKEIPVKANFEVPDKDQLNRMMLERKKRSLRI